MAKTYVDSDGVLSDFSGWIKSLDPSALHDNVKVDRLIMDHYKECYLVSKDLYDKGLYLDMVRTDPDYYVLTSVGIADRFKKSYPELEVEEIERRLEVLKENKYKWFEQRGVPREKVIITGKAREKQKYCEPGAVLIDDFEKSCNEWLENGGVALLVHNPDKEYSWA